MKFGYSFKFLLAVIPAAYCNGRFLGYQVYVVNRPLIFVQTGSDSSAKLY